MEVLDLQPEGLKIVKPKVFKDNRGYFFESYNREQFERLGLHFQWIQDNQSFSKHGVIRGLHYQLNPNAQTKLVRVLSGKIFDVAVDLRKNSPTFGKWHGEELTAENHYILLIPKGFAHGFSVLSETAVVLYKCDELYVPDAEGGILFNDPALNIDWRINRAVISEKDQALPPFEEARMNF